MVYKYSLHAKSWHWTMNKSSSKIIWFINIVCTLRVGVELWTSLVIRLFGFMNIVGTLRVGVELWTSLAVRLFGFMNIVYMLRVDAELWTLNKSSSKII